MKAVVFDMDGVLFDTERVGRQSWAAAAAKFGYSDMEEVYPLCIGRNETDTAGILRDRYGEAFPLEEFRRETAVIFWQYLEENGHPHKPGVREILTYLKEKGIPIAIASSTRQEVVERHLKRAGIFEEFDRIIGGDRIVHSKPEPDIYLLACRELGVTPEEAFAIEDSYNGIRSAYRAGMRPIMVPDLLPPTDEMRKLSEVILQDLCQVIGYLEENA